MKIGKDAFQSFAIITLLGLTAYNAKFRRNHSQ
jgi:hypothetical protein